MEDILALMIPIIFILATASVLILRPITKRLGDAIHQVQQDRHETRIEQAQLEQIRGLVESVQERLELLEQRQSFYESLMEARPQRRLEGAADRAAERALN